MAPSPLTSTLLFNIRILAIIKCHEIKVRVVQACLRLTGSMRPHRYKKPDERQPLVAAMHIFMPMLKERFIQLLPDPSSDSVLVQKQIFKILYALFQVTSCELLSEWAPLSPPAQGGVASGGVFNLHLHVVVSTVQPPPGAH